MASSMIHIAVANELNKTLNRDNKKLLIGDYNYLLVSNNNGTNIILKYEDFNTTIDLLYKMIDTVGRLTKWNGHLYNWYNIETLEPLNPRYVSSVDSGNFVGYLYTLKTFLIKNNAEEFLIELVTKLIVDTNFTVLYDDKKRLF